MSFFFFLIRGRLLLLAILPSKNITWGELSKLKLTLVFMKIHDITELKTFLVS